MDIRAEKLAKARKKLRDHQEKKNVTLNDYIPATDKLVHNENAAVPKICDDVTVDQVKGHKEINMCEVKEESNNLNITEILISNKTSLEKQIKDLSSKLAELEYIHESDVKNNHVLKEKVDSLESELNMRYKTHSMAIDEINSKDFSINELKEKNKILIDENNNLMEQLELTKSMLTTKELDITKLNTELCDYRSQLDVAKLQIQQLSNDSTIHVDHQTHSLEKMEELQQKVISLQQEINLLRKDRDNINAHYEHYVNDLNRQLRSELAKNETLSNETHQLYKRENSLIEQISDMEIRLQNYGNLKGSVNKLDSENLQELQQKCSSIQNELEEMTNKYNDIQRKHFDCLSKIKELTEAKEPRCDHDNISISKLNADIASDKLAAQRATEQNRKLKLDIEELEQVVVKMTKDKLELTEKLAHEKSLNKELILKLTDIEENAKNMNNKLKAKDDEMIRLQSGYREIERKHGKLLEDINTVKENTQHDCHFNKNLTEKNEINNGIHEENPLMNYNELEVTNTDVGEINIQEYDAMHKLQERFLKIMDEVANLSDEKHRLEHIILQLQNETDTICEYVALYQQQRSLLKKREEERNNQITIFETECNQLKHYLEELRGILLLIVEDEKILTFLKDESKVNDIARIKKLLTLLQGSSLLDAKFHKLDLNAFYPCSCCSGQLIDV